MMIQKLNPTVASSNSRNFQHNSFSRRLLQTMSDALEQNKLSCNPSFPCILRLYDTLAWQLMILYSILFSGLFPPYILLFTQAPILVWLDGTIIDISTILVTMYYSGYVGL